MTKLVPNKYRIFFYLLSSVSWGANFSHSRVFRYLQFEVSLLSLGHQIPLPFYTPLPIYLIIIGDQKNRNLINNNYIWKKKFEIKK